MLKSHNISSNRRILIRSVTSSGKLKTLYGTKKLYEILLTALKEKDPFYVRGGSEKEAKKVK